MPYGIGYIAAKAHNCRIIDARAHAVGAYKKLYKDYKHIQKVIPAVGYTKKQIRDLKSTIIRANPDMVVLATPTDLTKLLSIKVPIARVKYMMKPNKKFERILWKLIS